MRKCRATSPAAGEDLVPTMQELAKDPFADACSELILPTSLRCGHVNEGGSPVDGCVRFAESRLVGVKKSSDARLLINDQFLSEEIEKPACSRGFSGRGRALLMKLWLSL
jgi:hypothetical protein